MNKHEEVRFWRQQRRNDILASHIRMFIRATLQGWTHNEQDAEDLTQDTLTQATRAIEMYEIEQLRTLRVSAWLKKIAYHRFLNYKRDKSRRPNTQSIEGNDAVSGKEDDSSQQPEVVFEQQETRREIMQAITRLPVRFHKVLMLRLFQELTLKEVAQETHQPIGTVKSLFYNGIKLLGEELEKDGA